MTPTHCRRVTIGLSLLLGAALPGAASANTVDQVLALATSKPHSYDQMIAALTELDRSERVTVMSLGKSREGRAIAQVTVMLPGTQFGQAARVFVIARQHGSEVAGTEAMLAVIRHLARSNAQTDIALLQRVTFVIIPMVNPDGAVANRRRNAAGIDLNRDWASRTQPETKLVDWAFRIWRPNAFIDCHELPTSNPKASFRQNFLETIAEDPVLDANMTRMCSFLSQNIRHYESAHGLSMNVYYDDHTDNRLLAHRHFGLDYNCPSFLLESKQGVYSYRDRLKYHIVGVLVVANLLAQRVNVQQPAIAPQPTGPAYRPMVIPEIVAKNPPIRTPPVSGPKLPEKTTVRFAAPERDNMTFTDKLAVRVTVEKSADFAYMSVHVDGVMRTLTDSGAYDTTIEVENYAEGAHTILARAHDGGGRIIADAERTVVVKPQVAGP